MKKLFLISCIFCTTVQARNIDVKQQAGYCQSITQALAMANDGDTISVHKGLYREQNIEITKSIVLRGIGRPVLDGEKKYEILSVKASYVTITGLVLERCGVSSLTDFAAIKIYNKHHVTIEDNIINEAFFGVYSQFSRDCLIKNNVFTSTEKEEQNSGNGIHAWKSENIIIIGNTITGHRDGIYFEFVTHSLVWNNVSHHNLRYGLHFMFSNNDTYIGNTFEDNGAGVAVMFSSFVRMFNNHFFHNWGEAAYGLLLKEINDGYLQGNVFDKNTMAIYMEGSNRVIMRKNVFNANGWAMRMQASCMDVQVTENNFTGNSFDVGTNGSLVLNNFDGNYWDKYEGYDINRDGRGDVPYRPVSLYSVILEQNPPAIILFHSFLTTLMDKTEKVLPSLTPENLVDNKPLMKPLPL